MAFLGPDKGAGERLNRTKNIMSQAKLIIQKLLIATLLGGSVTLTASAKGAHTWASNSVLSEGTWVKVALNQTQDGIFQISYSDLRKWGFKHPDQVGVYGFGGHVLSNDLTSNHIDDLPEVAVLHDKEHSRILFYGRGIITWQYDPEKGFVQRQHPYATASFYFLHEKDGAPKAIPQMDSDTAKADLTVREYDEYWLQEQEEYNLGEAGQEWYGPSFVFTNAQSFSLPNETALSGHIIKAGTARLTVSFVAKATVNSTFRVTLNNEVVGTGSISATSDYGAETTLDKTLPNVLAMKDAKVGITYSTSNGTTPSVAHLNYIRLQGKCDLTASDKEAYMLFRHAKARTQKLAYRVSQLNNQMQIWDVTSPNEIGRQMLQGDTLFVPEKGGLREYAIVNLQSTSFPSVTRVGNPNNQNLHHCDSIDWVIVTPAAYWKQADSLAAYRAYHDGLSCTVVTPEAIYNEYSSGVPDATAIRLFLKNLYDKGKSRTRSVQLKYMLLFGDGSYDNRAACQSNFLLPCYENTSSLSETSSYVTDDYFAFLDDNEGTILPSSKMDIGVGRLPVRNASQATDMLEKIIGYDNDRIGSWRNRLTFLADDEKIENGVNKDPENAHVKHCDEMVNTLVKEGHNEFIYKKIYLPAYQQVTSASGYDYPDARKEMNNMLQQGTLVFNYAGHGASNNITHEQMMSANVASQLRMDHLPVWIMASCNVSRWDSEVTSMGEALVLNPEGGAAAVIGATREVFMAENKNFNAALMQNLCKRHDDGEPYRLGDIVKEAKCALSSDANKLSYGLLGDPTMSLSLPEQRVVVDSLTGELKALGTVIVYGHINQPDTNIIDPNFTGLLYTTIFDAADSLTCDKGVWNGENAFGFAARNRKVFSGRSVVQNGKFSFYFTVPQDISSVQSNGLMNFYACSTHYVEANGYYDGYQLQQDPEADTGADKKGPTIIACFMDSPDFKDGDVVSQTPFFYAEVNDESGINATGNSIGHDLCLTISSLSNPFFSTRQYILNDYFTTFTRSPLQGNVKYSLTDLSEGTYQATFRVWDVYNNVTIKTFTFTVSSASRPTLASLQATPSPVKQGSTVTFTALHNRPESADQLRLQIYSQAGVLVLDKSVSTSSCEVVYLEDGEASPAKVIEAMNADETSHLMGRTTLTWQANVAPGIYLYRAYLTAGGEESVSESQKIIVY